MEFYRCSRCGNIITKLTDSKVPVVCCGEPMQKLEAGSVDAALEKHVPVAVCLPDRVEAAVGQAAHPMLPEHWIEWIVLEMERSFAVCRLTPGDEPRAVFPLQERETPKTVYAYCNLHGLWKTEL